MKTFSLNPIFATSFKGTFMALVFLRITSWNINFYCKSLNEFFKSFSSFFSLFLLLLYFFDEVIGIVFCDVRIKIRRKKIVLQIFICFSCLIDRNLCFTFRFFVVWFNDVFIFVVENWFSQIVSVLA